MSFSNLRQIVAKQSELLSAALPFRHHYALKITVLCVAIWIQGNPTCGSDDVVTALTAYKRACEGIGCESHVTLLQSEDGWRPASVSCMFGTEEDITNDSFEPLKQLRHLGSIDIYAAWRKPDGHPPATAVSVSQSNAVAPSAPWLPSEFGWR